MGLSSDSQLLGCNIENSMKDNRKQVEFEDSNWTVCNFVLHTPHAKSMMHKSTFLSA